MKKIVKSLREWCGTECTGKKENEKERKDLVNDNRGDTHVFVALSFGTIFLILFCVLGMCVECVDKYTCGGCTKCISCASSCCGD